MSGDFSGLRSDVETNTVLPEFGEIETRARRQRRRQRFGNSVGTLGLLLLVLPALAIGGLALTRNSDTHSAIGISVAGPGTGHPSASSSARVDPTTVRLVAADGVDFNHLYGLTEVCRRTACDLQLVSLGGSMAVKCRDIFRTDPHQVLTDERMVALTVGTVRVFATSGNSGRPTTEQLLADLPPRDSRLPLRPVQVSPTDPVGVVSGTDPTVRPMTHEPDLTDVQLVGGSHGWWVAGVDPNSGQSAVSVSRDSGTTWTTGLLGAKVSAGSVVLATGDGADVYALARIGVKVALFRSVDGGVTWSAPKVQVQWGTPASYGISVGPTGVVQVFYVASDGDATFTRSTDGGQTFVPTGIPIPTNGQIVSVPGGYVLLGSDPQISTDGQTWTNLRLPYYDPLVVSP